MTQAYASITQQMLQAFQSQHLDTAERLANMILKINAKDLVALQVCGLSLAMQGRVAESVTPLYKAYQQDQKNPELLANLAKAQHGAHMYAEAIVTYKKLNLLIPNNAQILTDLGTSFAKAKNFQDAEDSFEKAIQVEPHYFLAWSNRGNLLAEMGFATDAIASYKKALDLKPDYAETWTNYGNALFDLSRYQEGRLAHEQALKLRPDYAEAWSNYGNTLLELKDPGDYEAYQKAYTLNPDHPFLIGQLFNAATCRCDWSHSQPLASKIISRGDLGEKVAHPFIFLQTNASLKLQKLAAEIFIHDRILNTKPNILSSLDHNGDGKKIRIGYFSSDFKEHPVGVLMQNLIKMHNRNHFEVYGFFLNAPTGDAIEGRLLDDFDASVSLHCISDSDAMNLVLAKKLDIAIDLNGHTSGARTALFARKIAPVQVNYLGYAGTSGAHFYDALIADQFVIPQEHQAYYSEPIAYLPNSFFPVDTSIPIESFGDLPTKLSEGLPEKGFIFACFNNAYKITPPIFDLWMNLLKEVPDSILWLSKPSPEAILNLQKEAKSRGIDESRLIFATRTPGRQEHLSRLRLADLFLDTSNYNAHATAADALWAGLPLLTQNGNTFAGKVAASLLNALSLNELIADSESEYFAKALEFARSPEKLKAIRDQLAVNRAHSPLFNTKQYVEDLESLYVKLVNKANLQ
ncbi:tetratricopeptide repeat protein [Polynucleobacter sp. CS-Odin-A6]|uniref:O-linked N-acetylglucosamine transferase, SPINDLY family protein n=1 Tax=Polynucleobacter sp. CS-Odin-A6 TaxID=2689106 RepID=UPI001C0B0DE1|nr:tetratricopeptide repeat protein [Polynucleobacter sp. CS-Odin-A6]MBU3622061.1 tetratricopeptide repeat protein [Polynucleobacter sp. CS-Odin-A6]